MSLRKRIQKSISAYSVPSSGFSSSRLTWLKNPLCLWQWKGNMRILHCSPRIVLNKKNPCQELEQQEKTCVYITNKSWYEYFHPVFTNINGHVSRSYMSSPPYKIACFSPSSQATNLRVKSLVGLLASTKKKADGCPRANQHSDCWNIPMFFGGNPSSSWLHFPASELLLDPGVYFYQKKTWHRNVQKK